MQNGEICVSNCGHPPETGEITFKCGKTRKQGGGLCSYVGNPPETGEIALKCGETGNGEDCISNCGELPKTITIGLKENKYNTREK